MSRLKSNLLREIGTVARFIQSISNFKYREIKLQRGQFVFLTRICEQPGINLIDLSNILKVDKTTTTKAIQRLMAENYVQRSRDNKDKRMWHLYPTEKAMAVYSFIIDEENRSVDICLSGFSQEERAMVHRLVEKIGENIEQGWNTYKAE